MGRIEEEEEEEKRQWDIPSIVADKTYDFRKVTFKAPSGRIPISTLLI